MPAPGKAWFHLILNTHNSWLHGDPRGFRSRGHRIHSSGDYKTPPPKDEHAGLHRYHQARSGHAVIIPPPLRPAMGEAVHRKLQRLRFRVLVISVGARHAHLLVELPNQWDEVKRVAGWLKQASSHAVRRALPGRVWGAGCDPVRVRDRAHHRRVYRYILDDAREGAWVWALTRNDGVDGGAGRG